MTLYLPTPLWELALIYGDIQRNEHVSSGCNLLACLLAQPLASSVDYGSMVLNQATWGHSVNDTGALWIHDQPIFNVMNLKVPKSKQTSLLHLVIWVRALGRTSWLTLALKLFMAIHYGSMSIGLLKKKLKSCSSQKNKQNKKLCLQLSSSLSTHLILLSMICHYGNKKGKNGWVLVGQLELVPFQLLGGEGVALVPGQVQHLRAGFFMNPDEQHGSGVSFFLGQRKTSD